jgi:hypothetical protein
MVAAINSAALVQAVVAVVEETTALGFSKLGYDFEEKECGLSGKISSAHGRRQAID